ncbi:sirohydrochlorin chelatase [Gordonia insulae]|uniref:Sirohydrochlorin cobaltochelatase n=1 Tax=Gordonia insulae TaxID=2420509 RepID=A0A3G8JEM5_9ACTN|nr:sirohydrochlorin chelatase [Gordonia insulae]AZG43537.1 Sirohydrochlorin cobaltochelatase [Gordonia insulae]
MLPTLLLVAHGSRDARFPATAGRVRDAVADALPGADVRLSYLDLNEPLVGDTLDEVTGDCVVVPLLFAAGYHQKVDLPAIVAAHERPGRAIMQADVIGEFPLASALADRLREAGVNAADGRTGIVLSAVGSSDPSADQHVRRRAIELSTLLNRPVEVVFATKLGPREHRLRSAIRRLRAAGAQRIAVSPYFLSAGLLTERVEAALDDHAPGSLVAGPLGAHRDIVDAVCHHYWAAASADRPTVQESATTVSVNAATFVARA